jgi:hypothetical protein
MATSTRISAKNIIFKLPTTDYAPDCTSIKLELADAQGDVRTFSEVSVGKQWNLTLEGIASGDTASLYQLLFTNWGTEVAFTVAPNGNATPSASQPHWAGTVVFDDLPPLDLVSGDIATFSVTLTVKNNVHTPSATPPIFWGLTRKIS